MKRLFQHIAIGVIGLFIVWKGIIPAFTDVDTDFPNYYTSSRLVLEGKDISRLYDDNWFQEQMTAYGIEQQGKFSPFPPVTAFIMIPLAMLSPQGALRVWTVINIIVLITTAIVLTKIADKDWRWSCLLILGGGVALINNFRFGQWYLILAFLMLMGYYFLERKRLSTAGILFGIGAAFKYFPIVVLPILLLNKQWSAVLSFILTIALIYCVGLVTFGTQLHSEFFSRVLNEHISGNIQNPFSATFQSWNSLLRRLFMYDPLLNPLPVVNSTLLFQGIKDVIIATVAGASCWALKLTYRIREKEKLAVQVALITIGGMLLLPASATYHFLILVLPLGLLLRGKNHWNIWQKILVGSFLMIGFLPYRYFRDFDGKQWLTVLAYPRLWLATIMFIARYFYVAKYSKHSLNSESVTA